MSLLDDYYTRPQLSAEVKKSERTIQNWENLPDGLPYTWLGGQKLYKKDSVRSWLERREQWPNPRRKSA